MEKDIRWQQRFSNFLKAYKLLANALKLRNYSDLERLGLLHRFEYSTDLMCDTIKDYLHSRGFHNLTGSKDAIRHAYQAGLINDTEKWLEMIDCRNLIAHAIDEDTSIKLTEKIKGEYFYIFKEFVSNFA